MRVARSQKMTNDGDMRTRAEVAKNVRAALGAARVSQAGAAKALGMSPGTFNRRVNGKTAFDVEELERLATFLDVPYSQLVEVTPR